MSSESHDPRDIPILTEPIGKPADASTPAFDFNAVHAAILTETLKLADSLLRQAARDIEATLFERVFDRLRTELPSLGFRDDGGICNPGIHLGRRGKPALSVKDLHVTSAKANRERQP